MPLPRQPKLKKAACAKTPAAAASLTHLLTTKRESKNKHGRAARTLDSYERRLRQAKEWLKEQLESEKALECPTGCPEISEPCKDWTLNDLGHVFDKKPNRASPSAVALFIAWKCFNGENNLKRGVAEQTHAAFKKFWEEA